MPRFLLDSLDVPVHSEYSLCTLAVCETAVVEKETIEMIAARDYHWWTFNSFYEHKTRQSGIDARYRFIPAWRGPMRGYADSHCRQVAFPLSVTEVGQINADKSIAKPPAVWRCAAGAVVWAGCQSQGDTHACRASVCGVCSLALLVLLSGEFTCSLVRSRTSSLALAGCSGAHVCTHSAFPYTPVWRCRMRPSLLCDLPLRPRRCRMRPSLL